MVQPASLLGTHAKGYEFDRPGSVWNCQWGHAFRRSHGINRKSRVLYPGPGLISSATWHSMSKKHVYALIIDHIPLFRFQRAILLCACFIVAWTPYAIFSFITSFFGVEISLELTTLPSMFAKSSTMYNPIIYFFLVKTYREEVKQFLPKRFRRIPRLRLIEDTTSRKQQKSGDS